MRLVALLLILASAACFPHNAKHRKIAKWSEGGAIAGGIALLAVSSTGADCTAGPAGRPTYDACRRDATIVGNVGLGLILVGLVGFGITQMTSGDGETAPPPKPLLSEDDSEDVDATKPKLPGRAAIDPTN